MRSLSMAVLLLFFVSCSPAFAHRWLMDVVPWAEDVDMERCQGIIALAADMISREMTAKNYYGGVINAGGRAVRLDSVGHDDTGLYVFCSESGQYVIVAHSVNEDDDLFKILWRAIMRQFPKH